jgi:hypothetical protein
MFRRNRLLLLAAAVALLSSTNAQAICLPPGDPLCELVDNLDDRMKQVIEGILRRTDDLTKLVDNRLKDLVRTVPGERWIQLHEALLGPDPAKREEAQRLLASWLQVSGGSEKRIETAGSMRFVLKSDRPFKFARRTIAYAGIEDAKLYVSESLNWREARTSHRTVTNIEQIKKDLRSDLGDAFDKMSGGPPGVYHIVDTGDRIVNEGGTPAPRFFRFSLVWQGSFLANIVGTAHPSDQKQSDLVVKHAWDNNRSIRELFIDNISKSILRIYEDQTMLTGDAADAFNWDIRSHQNYLMVFIDEETFNSHPDFEIIASMHVKDKPNESAFDQGPYSFRRNDFEINEPIRSPLHGTVYWARHEFSGQPRIDPEILKMRDELRVLLARLGIKGS